MYDLNKLAPEEKDKLLMQLLTKYDNEVSTPGLHGAEVSGEHPDAEADKQMLEPFAKVLEVLIDKVEELEDRIQKNESLVVDELFGGIDRMYKANLRSKSIDDLRGKYGEVFSPYMDGIKELAPNEDLYEALHDMLEPLRAGEGWNDEQELGTVKSAADAIAQKLAKLRGSGSEPAPEGVAVEVTKTEAIPAKKASPEAAFIEKVKEMKKRNSARGL